VVEEGIMLMGCPTLSMGLSLELCSSLTHPAHKNSVSKTRNGMDGACSIREAGLTVALIYFHHLEN